MPLTNQRRPLMAQPLIDQVLTDARTIITDRKRRLRACEAVTADGDECDPCSVQAQRFCAVGALIRAAFELTGNHERAHVTGWQVAGKIADAANLLPVEDEERAGASQC